MQTKHYLRIMWTNDHQFVFTGIASALWQNLHSHILLIERHESSDCKSWRQYSTLSQFIYII